MKRGGTRQHASISGYGWPSSRQNAKIGGEAVLDLQVRLGVDTNGDTNIDQYVNPGAVPANGVVVSATIWLRIRAEEREIGYVNDTPFQYADMGAAVTPDDNYRRILLTKTIHIRNTRA